MKAKTKKYKRIGKTHPAYRRMIACREAGIEFCDAVTHNSPKGCKNPDCWKYTP